MLHLIQHFCPDALSNVKNDSVDTIITSPPYFGKYDYDLPDCPVQLGHEDNVESYIETMGQIAAELYRVTKPNGVFWCVIGDTFNNYSAVRRGQAERRGNTRPHLRRSLQEGYWEKEVLGVPFKLKDEYHRRGWACRSINIWNKPQWASDSAVDRPVITHEYVLQFVKPAKGVRRLHPACSRLPNSVWTFSPEGQTGHPAAFPIALVKFLLDATPGKVVLDPFMGSGTTGVAALEQNRSFIGIEPSMQYYKIAKDRIHHVNRSLFASLTAE